MNGNRCDKLSTAVSTVRVHSDKYEDIDAVITFLTQFINKQVSTPSVKITSVAQTRHAKWQKTSTIHCSFKGKIDLKKYSTEEYDSVSMAQRQQLYVLLCKAGLLKGKKTPENSKALEARVALLKAVYSQIKSSKLITELITEREAEPDKAKKTLDH